MFRTWTTPLGLCKFLASLARHRVQIFEQHSCTKIYKLSNHHDVTFKHRCRHTLCLCQIVSELPDLFLSCVQPEHLLGKMVSNCFFFKITIVTYLHVTFGLVTHGNTEEKGQFVAWKHVLPSSWSWFFLHEWKMAIYGLLCVLIIVYSCSPESQQID